MTNGAGSGAAATAVAVVPDLFFQSKIREAARISGVPLVVAATEEALSEALAAGGVGVVILSLDSPSPDPFRILSIVREKGGARTVGFLSHVLEDLRDRAIEAGCDRVLAKGAFARGLPEILVEMAGQRMERNP